MDHVTWHDFLPSIFVLRDFLTKGVDRINVLNTRWRFKYVYCTLLENSSLWLAGERTNKIQGHDVQCGDTLKKSGQLQVSFLSVFF